MELNLSNSLVTQKHTYLPNICADEYKINTAEAQLCYTDKVVDQSLHKTRPFAPASWCRFKTLFNCFGKIRILFRILKIFHFNRTVNQHMLTVYTDQGYEECKYGCHQKPAMFKSETHCKKTRSDVTLKEMYNRLKITVKLWWHHKNNYHLKEKLKQNIKSTLKLLDNLTWWVFPFQYDRLHWNRVFPPGPHHLQAVSFSGK